MEVTRRSFTLPAPATRQNNRPRIGSMMVPTAAHSNYFPLADCSYIRTEESDCLPPTCSAINIQLAMNSPCTCGIDDSSTRLELISPVWQQSNIHHSERRPLRPLLTSTTYGPPSIIPKASLAKQSKNDLVLYTHKKKKGQMSCFAKCVVCVAINIVFVVALFAVIFIGNFSSNAGFSSNNTETGQATLFQAASFDTSFSGLVDHSTFLNSKSGNALVDNNDQEIAKFFAQEERKQISSIKEIYPSSLIDPEYSEEEGKRWLSNFDQDYTNAAGETSLYALPDDVVPKHCSLYLDFSKIVGPTARPQIFGNVTFQLELFENSTSNEIVFHAAANIFILGISLSSNGRRIDIKSVQREIEKDTIRVHSNEHLPSAFYTLTVEFHTRICASESEGVHCFYSQHENKHEAIIAGFSTKFEPNFARKFVPGWDEPRFKSTFNVSIKHLSSITVLSNTPTIKKTLSGPLIKDLPLAQGITLTEYEQTPPMPLYLLAFATGPFTPIDLRTPSKLPLKIWTDPSEVMSFQYAANFSPIMFDRIQQNFGVKYPLLKLDFFVTPTYPIGGMENWGVIVFHSSTIRVDPQFNEDSNVFSRSSSSSEVSDEFDRHYERQFAEYINVLERTVTQYRAEKAITHELVHQWFGNLVTISAWSHLWLSEGFATYFVYDFLSTDRPYLTQHDYYMRLVELFQKQIISVTGFDAPPLVHSPSTTTELNNMFDGAHLYTKGAILVKIMKDLIGPHEFRACIARYLRQNAFKSVDSNALWSSFPEFVDYGTNAMRLSDAIHPWLYNNGMPEIIVSQEYETNSVKLIQRAFNQNNWIVYLSDTNTNPNGKSSFENSLDSFEWRKKRQVVLAYANQKLDKVDSFLIINHINESKMTVEESEQKNSPPIDIKTNWNCFDKNKKRKETRKNDACSFKKPKNAQILYAKKKLRKSLKNNQKVDRMPEHREKSLKTKKTKKSHLKFPKSKNEETKPWAIPFSYFCENAKVNRQFWFFNQTLTFKDIALRPNKYFLANPGWLVPYQVNYNLENWRLLIEKLHTNFAEIPTTSRMQLIVDSEIYLKQSSTPHIYVELLGYLSQEVDFGVLLVGLDAIYRVLEMFSAVKDVFGLLIIHLMPAIEQINRHLPMQAGAKNGQNQNRELSSLWLLESKRLPKMYKLQCLANLDSCRASREVQNWISFPNALNVENNRQLIAVCHHLLGRVRSSEISLLAGLLSQKEANKIHILSSDSSNSFLTVVSQLIKDCVQESKPLLHKVVQDILETKNALVYLAALNNEYSLQYNRKFREIFWTSLVQKLSVHERQLLFAMNTGKSDWVARTLLHSVRSLGELNLVKKIVLPQWPKNLIVHIEYLSKKLSWIESEASKQIKNHLLKSH